MCCSFLPKCILILSLCSSPSLSKVWSVMWCYSPTATLLPSVWMNMLKMLNCIVGNQWTSERNRMGVLKIWTHLFASLVSSTLSSSYSSLLLPLLLVLFTICFRFRLMGFLRFVDESISATNSQELPLSPFPMWCPCQVLFPSLFLYLFFLHLFTSPPSLPFLLSPTTLFSLFFSLFSLP